MRLLSVRLQKSSGLLIGKKQMFDDFLRNLEIRKTQPAGEETAMYNQAICESGNSPSLCKSLLVFEQSEKVIFRDIELKINGRSKFQALSTIREEFISQLIVEINKYFNLED